MSRFGKWLTGGAGSDPAPSGVAGASPDAVSRSGFYGKIPSRGDFVGDGLPVAVTKVWDRWISTGIAAARLVLGEQWTSIWMEAPVWRFALPAGLCGEYPLIGLWMPSVDKVGRHFPLMIASACPVASACRLAAGGGDWLDAAEEAGRDALAFDLSPDALMARIPEPPRLADGNATGALPSGMTECGNTAYWWSAGGPHVAPRGLQTTTLPDGAVFAAMLTDGPASVPP